MKAFTYRSQKSPKGVRVPYRIGVKEDKLKEKYY